MRTLRTTSSFLNIQHGMQFHAFEARPGEAICLNPADGSTVGRRLSLSSTASASDNLAVQKVEFLINGNLICTDTSAPYSCTWKTPASTATVTIQAKAYDAGGNAASSHSRTINVR